MSEHGLNDMVGFTLVTANLPRLVGFYHDVLGFAVHGPVSSIDDGEMALLGLSGAGKRQTLSLGEQTLCIDQFEHAGRPYPAQEDAASLSFQHLALVVTDIHCACNRLRGITAISQGGPQQLPASSGGVQAFKFRDPELHPLEFLQFPEGLAPDAWRNWRGLDGQVGLGIDHSAISVSDAGASTAFYQALGLSIGNRTLNAGLAQQRLDGLGTVEVSVVPMMPSEATPHLELLCYHMPKGHTGPARRANDVAATRIVWRGRKARLISDPDGHLQQVQT
jgi:catechol 2,3-dioxygenase-like lactoylglutathione lyase family enzyme